MTTKAKKRTRFKKIPVELALQIEETAKGLLHASLDCLRNRGEITPTTDIAFDPQDGYYCEVFGMMRALELQGYGLITTGYSQVAGPANLRAWFEALERAVLIEEHATTSKKCDYCFKHFGKDTVRRRRYG